MGKTQCTNDCAEKLARQITLVGNFEQNILPQDMATLTAVLRSIENSHPDCLYTTTELRSLAAEFRIICQDPGENRRGMRLKLLRHLMLLNQLIKVQGTL